MARNHAAHSTRASSHAEKERRAQARDQLAAALRENLAAKVAALAESGEWMRFLAYAASFHRYSMSNVLLIGSQRPTATWVAGFDQWIERGRIVRKGEKAIRIYGYRRSTVTDTDPDTGEDTERTRVRYPILSVFDIDQTDPFGGETYRKRNGRIVTVAHRETPHPAQRLTGADPTGIYERIRAVLTARGWSVERDLVAGETNGYATCDGTRRIVVDARLAPAMAAKTALHEAAHACLHSDPASVQDGPRVAHRGVIETEAESVAHVLAGLLGLDTTAYSVGYIAAWSDADPDLLAATATRVLDTVRDLATALDPDHTTGAEDTDTGEETTGPAAVPA